MKYFFKVVIALAVALAVIFGFSYYYRQKKNSDNIVLTTQKISTTAEGETKTSSKKLVHENEEAGCKFYYDSDTDRAYVEYGSVEKELDGWQDFLNNETIESYYGDYDGDKEKEVLVFYLKSNDINTNLIAADKGDFDDFYYRAACFKLVKSDDGTEDIRITVADQNTWKKPFAESISAEVNQLKSCDKYLQLVMDNIDVELEYNEKTGISNNAYVFYACALKNDSGNGYQTLAKWSKGSGNYYMGDDGTPKLDIMVLAYYDGSGAKAQYVGKIQSGISIDENGEFDLTANTIKFIANQKYSITDPRDSSKEKFSFTVNNQSDAVSTINDNYISWLSGTFNVNTDEKKQNISFADMDSQIKCIEKIKFTQSSVVLTAKEGFEFSENPLNSGDYSVIINSGGDNEYDISYSAEISEKDARSILKIKFDRKYSKSELESVTVNFGS